MPPLTRGHVRELLHRKLNRSYGGENCEDFSKKTEGATGYLEMK